MKLNPRVLINIYVIFYINISLCSESTDLSPSFLPNNQFSFGAITVGSDIPVLTKLNNDSYEDTNSIRYRFLTDSSSISPLNCKMTLQSSEEYKNYQLVKTDLTSEDAYKILDLNKYFKEYYLDGSSEYSGSFFAGDNIVLVYSITKRYEYIPDNETMLPKLNKIFGDPIKIENNDPNYLNLVYSTVEKKLKNIPDLNHMSAILSMSPRPIKIFNSYRNKGVFVEIKSNRKNNTIQYSSIDVERSLEFIEKTYNQCVDKGKFLILELTRQEEKHNKKKSETFSL